MKYNKNMYLIAGAFIALVATYIGFTILRRTHEGLSDGASTTNDTIIGLAKYYDEHTANQLATLKGNPDSYINLLTSFKNIRMASAIINTINNKNGLAFANISDYDETIDYLRTLGVSDTVADDTAINDLIIANNTSTSTLLSSLVADNQAYIELLTSFKNNNMVAGIIDLMEGGKNHILRISDYDPTIDYLRTLAGITISTTPEVPTTRNISFSK